MGFQGDGASLHFYVLHKGTLLPALTVAHQAEPGASAGGLENELIVDRRHRFQAKNLHHRACRLAKPQSGVDYARVVVHQHCIIGQQLRHIVEMSFANVAPHLIAEQFALLTLSQRVLCNALVGKRVIVVGDAQRAHLIYSIHVSVRISKKNKQWNYSKPFRLPSSIIFFTSK